MWFNVDLVRGVRAGMVEYNPFSRPVADNPFPVYRRLRDDAPVYHNEELDFYALSRFDDVMNAHLDPGTLSSAHGVTIEGIDAGQPFLIVKDPPEHTAHRKIVSRVFTPRRIGALEPFIRARAGELLDRVRDQRAFDVAADFSIRLPLDVISELIGIPPSLRDEVHVLCDRITTRREGSTDYEDAFAANVELHTLLTGLVKDRRAHPGDDVISLLIASPIPLDDGTERSMDDDELAARFLELAFAGHETVAKLIPNGVIALAWYPDQRRELVADPSLMAGAVEEMLRWDPPSHYQGRWTTRDLELHGTTIPADRRVILLTGSAGHDERRYREPELFDLHRDVDRHVSFGFGAHLCLGAALARLETRIAFEELLARVPDYSIDEGSAVRQYSGNVRGLDHLAIVPERRTVSA
jgi:cytochrome P450